MKTTKARTIVATAALFVALAGSGYLAEGGVGEALAASAKQKAEFQQVLKSLQAVDTAYAAGNSAEAQSDFDTAKTNWNKVSPAISKREAREAQLLFDSLGKQLKQSAPATKVKSTVDGMLEELRGDIGEELQ